jgi:cobalt-zinc-cadmium efflux system outer membrane protein
MASLPTAFGGAAGAAGDEPAMRLSLSAFRTLAAAGGLSLTTLAGWAQMPMPNAARPATGAPLPATPAPATAPATTTGQAPGPHKGITPAQLPGQPTASPTFGQPGAPLTSPGGALSNGASQLATGAASSAAAGTSSATGAGTTFGQYPVAMGAPAGAPTLATPTDTLRLTLDQAQVRFMQANFQLLAQHFNIDVANAAIRQALLRDNPNLQMEVNAYNPNTGAFFPLQKQTDPVTPTGGTFIAQIQQLIDISGRRSKLVQLSRTGVAVQQAAFEDLLRQARFQLVQSFYNVSAERRKLSFTEQERTQLGRLLAAYRERLRLGVVASYEVTRLELEQQSLERDRADLLNQLTQDQATLRVLLAAPGTVFVAPEGVDFLPTAPASVPALADLEAQAFALRPDLRAATQQTAYTQQNLAVQRSLAVPKLMVGADYASQGNTYVHYFGLQTAIDMPVFNRNQGNIQAAKIGIQQSGFALNGVHLQVEQDVASAYEQLQRAIVLRQSITPDYLARTASVSRDAVADYNRRLIDLVSFIDKFRAYKEAQLGLIDISSRLLQTEQQINFATNAKVF